MNKKLICLFLCFIFLLGLASCSPQQESSEVSSGATADQTDNNQYFPSPQAVAWEKSDNATGARFDMTLAEYTDAFNKMYNSLGGGSEEIEYSSWQKMKSGEKDENGVEYDYYYYSDDKAVLTATVETGSEKLMNLGCGTTVAVFVDNTNTNYQTIVLTMAGIMASVAGGYSVDNVKFFSDLYIDTISNSNNSFWYKNGIYLLNIEEGSSDDNSTMLFRVVAAEDKIKDEWDLVDYATYYNDMQGNNAPTSSLMGEDTQPTTAGVNNVPQ